MRQANSIFFALKSIKIQLTKPFKNNLGLLNYSSRGSVTMEYIIVSSFALLLSISAVTWIGKTIKARIDHLANKLGNDAGEFDVDINPTQ
jgi:hypothetical protein